MNPVNPPQTAATPTNRGATIKVAVNDQAMEFPGEFTVDQLLRQEFHRQFGVAVELNGNVVPATEHANTPLSDGDRLEVVTLAGGG